MSLKIEQGFRLPEPLFKSDDPRGESSRRGENVRVGAIPKKAEDLFDTTERPFELEVTKGGKVTVKKQVTPSGDTE